MAPDRNDAQNVSFLIKLITLSSWWTTEKVIQMNFDLDWGFRQSTNFEILVQVGCLKFFSISYECSWYCFQKTNLGQYAWTKWCRSTWTNFVLKRCTFFLHIFSNESNYTFEWIDTFKKCNAQIFRLLNLILGAGLMWVPPGTQKYDFL